MAQPSGVDVSRWQGTIDWPAVKQGGVNFFGGSMEDLIAYAGGSQPPPPTPPELEKRVGNLEKWAEEIDAWAREQGYDGVGPEG